MTGRRSATKKLRTPGTVRTTTSMGDWNTCLIDQRGGLHSPPDLDVVAAVPLPPPEKSEAKGWVVCRRVRQRKLVAVAHLIGGGRCADEEGEHAVGSPG